MSQKSPTWRQLTALNQFESDQDASACADETQCSEAAFLPHYHARIAAHRGLALSQTRLVLCAKEYKVLCMFGLFLEISTPLPERWWCTHLLPLTSFPLPSFRGKGSLKDQLSFPHPRATNTVSATSFLRGKGSVQDQPSLPHQPVTSKVSAPLS